MAKRQSPSIGKALQILEERGLTLGFYGWTYAKRADGTTDYFQQVEPLYRLIDARGEGSLRTGSDIEAMAAQPRMGKRY